MIEVTGDLWEYPADVRVITTNGTVKKNGECVMGRGCAWEAKQKYPNLASSLGLHIQNKGNCVGIIRTPDAAPPVKHTWLVSFPVKHAWFQKADPLLIVSSAIELVELADNKSWQRIVIPRPGCGNGKLQWADVRELLKPILDDRFHIITKG